MEKVRFQISKKYFDSGYSDVLGREYFRFSKVRKNHKCSFCGKEIGKGELAYIQSENSEYKWFNDYYHLECIINNHIEFLKPYGYTILLFEYLKEIDKFPKKPNDKVIIEIINRKGEILKQIEFRYLTLDEILKVLLKRVKETKFREAKTLEQELVYKVDLLVKLLENYSKYFKENIDVVIDDRDKNNLKVEIYLEDNLVKILEVREIRNI